MYGLDIYLNTLMTRIIVGFTGNTTPWKYGVDIVCRYYLLYYLDIYLNLLQNYAENRQSHDSHVQLVPPLLLNIYISGNVC